MKTLKKNDKTSLHQGVKGHRKIKESSQNEKS